MVFCPAGLVFLSVEIEGSSDQQWFMLLYIEPIVPSLRNEGNGHAFHHIHSLKVVNCIDNVCAYVPGMIAVELVISQLTFLIWQRGVLGRNFTVSTFAGVKIFVLFMVS